MKPFTLDNHFVYGYNAGIFNPQDKIKQNSLSCTYTRSTRPIGNFRDECVLTAIDISNQAKNLKRTPMIFLSGGLDSEIVVKSFIDANVDFVPVTFKLANGLNIHEINFVEKFCKRHNLKVQYINIDIVDWFNTPEAKQKYIESFCTYTEMLPHMKLMDIVWNEFQGLPVMGNGDFYAIKSINPVWRMHDNNATKYIWNYIEFEYILAWFRYAVSKNILGGIGFFQHNPEITLAMATDSLMVSTCTNQTLNKMSSRSTKYEIYKKYWNDIEHRPKWHGGELVSKLHRLKTLEYSKELKMPYNDYYSIEYKKFIDILLP
jgi:hypothetical protein